MTRYAFALACLLSMSGCVTTGSLYDWGNYEDNLFNYYHKPAVKEAVLDNHLGFLAELAEDNRKPPPGLLAEAGTLLLLEGETEKAIEYYQKEYEAWPESQPMMSKLITNLKDREK